MLGYSTIQDANLRIQYHFDFVIFRVNNLLANAVEARDRGLIPGWEDPLEEGMATYSSILAWGIPKDREPGGLESMGSQRVGHD